MSVEGFAVEFDYVAVRVEDINLRVARNGIGPGDEAAKAVGWKVLAESFLVQPVDGFAVALYAQREVDILRVIRPARPL